MHFHRVDLAIQFAAQCHAGQERDGEAPLPYITHPIEVLSLVRNVGGVTDEDVLVAAVLHDVLEETDATEEELRERFGARAAALIKELTRWEPTEQETAGLSKSEIWSLRSKALLAEIAQMSPDAQQVKLADRISNLRGAVTAKSPAKLERYVRQTDEILKIVPERTNPSLWTHLKELYSEVRKNLR